MCVCVCVAYRIGYFQYISKIETQAASPFFYKKKKFSTISTVDSQSITCFIFNKKCELRDEHSFSFAQT